MKITKARLKNFQYHEFLEINFSKDINVISGITGTGKCLTGDTIIPCPITGKNRTINEMLLQSNWKVWSLNKHNKITIGTVKNIQINGIKHVFEIILKSGQKIKATCNHKFLTNRGWLQLKDITPNDYIASVNQIPQHFFISNKYSPKQCFVLGCLLGDGSFTGHITFTNADKHIIKKFVKELHEEFGDHHCKRIKQSKAITLDFTAPLKLKQRKNMSLNPIRNWIIELGLFNLKSQTKYIPSEFFQLSNECISNLIAGLFLCDGYVPIKNKVLEYSSSSEKLIYQIQNLLLRFGIHSCISKTYKHYTKNGISSKKFPCYILRIGNKNDIIHFSKTIPLIGIKNQKLKKLCKLKQSHQNNHADVYPSNFSELLYKTAKKSKYTARELNEKSGYKKSKSYHIGQYGRNVSQLRGQKIAKILKDKNLNKLFLSDIKWLKIKSINELGKEQTFDLEVLTYHNFLANDMIVHNSSTYRALEWLFGFSNISENDYRREGTNETSVKVWLDNNFQVERIRTNSINRYILSQKDSEDKVFDNFGRNVPEEIAEVLNISAIDIENEHLNLNFANQDQLNFLLDARYSDSFKAKLFNALTGNELIDKMFKELNRESLRCNREIKENEELVKKQEEELADYSLSYKSLKKKLCIVKEQYKEIQDNIKIYETLKELSDKLKSNKENQAFIEFKKSQIKSISDDKIKELKEQASLLQKLEQIEMQLEKVYCDTQEIQLLQSKVKEVDIDFDKLKEQSQQLTKLKELSEDLLYNTVMTKKVNKQLQEKENELKNTEQELKEIWDKQEICPLCKREIKK